MFCAINTRTTACIGPNAKRSNGIEPLFLICDSYYKHTSNGKDLDVVKLVVQIGADIHVRDLKQRNILHCAIKSILHCK